MVEFILQYWLAFLMGGISWLFKRYFKSIDNKMDKFILENHAMKAGIQAVLRDRIRQSHQYLMDKGYATVEDRDNIFNMYEQYHNLGANGVIDCLIDEIIELPVRMKKE